MREMSTNPFEYGEHILIDGVEYVVEEADGCDRCAFYHSNDSRKCGSIPCNSYGKIFRKVNEEPHYRPYKDTEEMIADFKKRFKVSMPAFCMPLIWVTHKSGDKSLITGFGKGCVCMYDEPRTMKTLFDEFTYLDGSPCGKVEG